MPTTTKNSPATAPTKQAATQHVAPVPSTTTTVDEVDLDAHSGMADRDWEHGQPGDANDETFIQERARTEREVKTNKCLKGLAGPHGVAVYRELARRSKDVTDAEYRILDTLLSFSTRLENCFPSRRTLLTKLGGQARKARVLDHHRQSLERKGWLKRIPFQEGDCVARVTDTDDGQLCAANETGRFISATGYVFCIPPNEIGPGEPCWQGPDVFNKRLFGKGKTGAE